MSKQIILSFFTIFISFLVGCGNSKAENEIITSSEKPAWELNKEEITLDWYINYSWYTTPWGQNIVSKAITEDTGVSIKFTSFLGSSGLYDFFC